MATKLAPEAIEPRLGLSVYVIHRRRDRGLKLVPRTTEVTAIAVATAAASIFFGIVPSPLLELAADAARAILGTRVIG